MKTTLLAVALLFASFFSNAQRIFEKTYGSWVFPNLSVETHKDLVISGFTERHPMTGIPTPTFKIATISGSPVFNFHVEYPDGIYLMDFVVREQTNTIVYVGMTSVTSGGTPHKMIVGEVDLAGTPIQGALEYEYNGNNMIPHQVVLSENMGQATIVGTEVMGTLDPSNYAFLPKFGFVLGLDINNFNAGPIYMPIEMDMPLSSNWDYDMLESLTETPAGYFITGSCNVPGGRQGVVTMGIDYWGNLMFSNIIDNSNSRYAGASVMYHQGLDEVYLLVNNSALHQHQIARCNPYSGNFSPAPFDQWYMHPINTLPVPIGSGIDQNGFRLQQTPDGFIVIGGYLSNQNGIMPALLTPFQITLREDFKFAAAKVFQSDNNAPLAPSYFEENGNSVFINTPDIVAYNRHSKRTYYVNQNSNMGGIDLHVSSLLKPSNCERAHKVAPFIMPPNFIGSTNYNPLPMYPAFYMPNPKPRQLMDQVICNDVAPLPIVTAPNNPVATVSPNPASQQLSISLKEEKIQEVKVFDMKGNVILTQTATERSQNEMSLNVEKLVQGAYILEITNTEGTVQREKFVKE